MALSDGSQGFEFFDGGFYPACGSERSVVGRAEAVSGTDVVMEYTAVIHHTCNELDLMTNGRREDQLAGPWLQWA